MLVKTSPHVGVGPISMDHIEKVEKALIQKGVLKKDEHPTLITQNIPDFDIGIFNDMVNPHTNIDEPMEKDIVEDDIEDINEIADDIERQNQNKRDGTAESEKVRTIKKLRNKLDGKSTVHQMNQTQMNLTPVADTRKY